MFPDEFTKHEIDKVVAKTLKEAGIESLLFWLRTF